MIKTAFSHILIHQASRMSSDEEMYKKVGVLVCKGEKYRVDFHVENNDTLIIQVENTNTQQHWLGKYDSACKCSIEFIFGSIFWYYINNYQTLLITVKEWNVVFRFLPNHRNYKECTP